MSEQRTLGDLQNGPEALTPLSNEEAMHISGGSGSLPSSNPNTSGEKCPPGYMWSPQQKKCVLQ